MASALSNLARAAKGILSRRSGSTSGLGSVLSRARETASRVIGSGGLGRRASRMDRRGRRETLPVPAGMDAPPVDARAFLAQLEKLARGDDIDPREVAEIEAGLRNELGGAGGLPPPPPPPGVGPPPEDEGDEEETTIEVLGRDYGYHQDEFAELIEGQVQVSSSNVYSHFYQPESRYSGIVYVTFLAPAPKGQPRTEPGPTYAYYDVTRGKYERFRREAEASAGSAVWDHLRVRGTLWNHQHRYRLVHVSGEYIPRRATFRGFRERYLRPLGPGVDRGPLPKSPAERRRELRRRGFRRSTLPEQLFDSGEPDRGLPDRGRP